MSEKKMEAKRNWRFRWLCEVFLLSHIKYQKGLWIERKYPNEIGWFSEDICKYFDDLFLDDNYDYQIKNGIISQAEFELIKDFHLALDNFVEETNRLGVDFDDSKILENKNWLRISQLGKSSWNGLKQLISDKDEIEHMNSLEKNYLT